VELVVLSDIENIRTLVGTIKIHHRQGLSFNMLGSALKVIARTPDFEDWEQKN